MERGVIEPNADLLDDIGSEQVIFRPTTTLLWPKGSNRPTVPVQVPDEFGEDYREACLVLADSPKASAALSRRCLQHILREKVGVKPGTLYSEIQQVIDSRTLPSAIARSIDAIRAIGNFSTHPTKSEKTGAIVPVEVGEAEWCLDVIEMLYDFYFVRPDDARRRAEAINVKLKEAGRNPIKFDENEDHRGIDGHPG